MNEALLPIRYHIFIDRAKIVYLNMILDSYEGLGMLRTADENAGEIIVYSTNLMAEKLEGLFAALQSEGVRIEITKTDNIDEIT